MSSRFAEFTPAEFSSTVLGELEAASLDPVEIRRVVLTALEEDLRYGPDVTTMATVPADAIAVADVASRRAGTMAGIPVFLAVLDTVVGPDQVEVHTELSDGDRVAPGQVALRVKAPVRGLLTAERTALNLLCHLSGIATLTSAWVAEVRGTNCVIRDSRKTTPGLRHLEKYAVRCGDGANHRMGLGDAVLIKDNHVVAAGSVTDALNAVRAYAPDVSCEVEVTTLTELDAVLAARAELVLLDNFSPQQCAEAVRVRNAIGSRTRLEASGGLTLDVAREYAATGVDYLAVGGLTHSAPALDLGLDLL
ncbi:carboxylating nicotinate-nucleotide diphosphorylase [Actinoalloteichus hymeniacidonis]|uniref:Nicotinate-nucleotide pyrophosphorylase [carboxylating] n=1 Tax=Actinoalloteichus hymeniacidonis TaxID=340345 RepID=A0AAC9MYC4_9PSEU|nr:carboxylating nicotinate-nucleotide diphosphorylase [Actinoalloteichus hymeniacidonis]AOS62746.1 nicotinate-nucleotide pyrophosphorylase (carboxylating) [Actinoalloteichus hymeniacidonis]MBB5909223.1 nicotinate-nucleotide pyrophosphorylase (carboxylating) [Actinoalloteichus hymeniacidonis]